MRFLSQMVFMMIVGCGGHNKMKTEDLATLDLVVSVAPRTPDPYPNQGECPEYNLDMNGAELNPDAYVGGTYMWLVFKTELEDGHKHYVSCAVDHTCSEGTLPPPSILGTEYRTFCTDPRECCDIGPVERQTFEEWCKEHGFDSCERP